MKWITRIISNAAIGAEMADAAGTLAGVLRRHAISDTVAYTAHQV